MTDSDLSFHDTFHKFEKDYWGDCCNTFFEERKHYVYARLMGIPIVHEVYLDAAGKSILDIGGGPVSMLLKTVNPGPTMMVADPIEYPSWVYARYAARDIGCIVKAGEYLKGQDATRMLSNLFDEVWIYNVLQHAFDPELVVRNARKLAPVIRIFEWIDFPPHAGHPHMLRENILNAWLDGRGYVEWLARDGCYGNSFSGVFQTGG